MGAVKTKMIETEASINETIEQMKSIVQQLKECGLVHKAARTEEAIKLLSFDIWEDNTIENIKEVRSTVRTARHGSNSYFSVRVYVEMFNGECKAFTIPRTYGYDRSSYVQHIKELLLEELAIKLPRFDSMIPFPFEVQIESVKYSELHKGESA